MFMLGNYQATSESQVFKAASSDREANSHQSVD